MDVESDEVCWICLDEKQEGQPLYSPCACPRKVHPKCLARWQLQQAGRPEETHCRFCSKTLADWKSSLTPENLKPEVQKVQPIMVVYFEGEIHRIPVKQGSDGVKEFTSRIRELFRLPEDVDISLTFGCKEPMSGQHLKLEGIGAFDAAVHCASVAAAERQHKSKSAGGSSTSSGSSGGGAPGGVGSQGGGVNAVGGGMPSPRGANQSRFGSSGGVGGLVGMPIGSSIHRSNSSFSRGAAQQQQQQLEGPVTPDGLAARTDTSYDASPSPTRSRARPQHANSLPRLVNEPTHLQQHPGIPALRTAVTSSLHPATSEPLAPATPTSSFLPATRSSNHLGTTLMPAPPTSQQPLVRSPSRIPSRSNTSHSLSAAPPSNNNPLVAPSASSYSPGTSNGGTSSRSSGEAAGPSSGGGWSSGPDSSPSDPQGGGDLSSGELLGSSSHLHGSSSRSRRVCRSNTQVGEGALPPLGGGAPKPPPMDQSLAGRLRLSLKASWRKVARSLNFSSGSSGSGTPTAAPVDVSDRSATNGGQGADRMMQQY